MYFLLLIFIHSSLIKGNDATYFGREFCVITNLFAVIFFLLYVFFSKKIYSSTTKKKILFGVFSFILLGLFSDNSIEKYYSFQNEKSACSYWKFCDNKNVYYESNDYFIFISDKYKINVLKKENDKYKLIYKDLKYTEKKEEDNRIRYIFDIGDNDFIVEKNQEQPENLEPLYLYDSNWQVIDLYGTVVNEESKI